jgi:hypothetical protein
MVCPDIEYLLDIPDEKVDRINSIIVFQNIHPEIGFRLLRDLLDRLNLGGGISIQLSIFKDTSGFNMSSGHLQFVSWDGGRLKSLLEAPHAHGTMLMYDYDLNRVMALLHEAGINRVDLEHTNHGGFHGVMMLGRKAQSISVFPTLPTGPA